MNIPPLRLCVSIVASPLIGFLLIVTVASGAAPADFDRLRKQYDDHIHAIAKTFCLDCHSTESKEGELDLQRFATLADVRRDPKAWQSVAQMLDNGEMPPEDSQQPTDAQRQQLRGWVQSYLNAEALAGAGDPGPVVLRRLTNSEYNYTAGDLTGIDSLNPTAEFPVDGAAGEGFTNSGSAQGMSPSLVQKYLDAAKTVADHAVLLPDGIRFSRHVTRRDQTDELLSRIQAFYREFTEDGGGSAVDLQGIKFDTNQGGLLPIETYIKATLAERDALASGNTSIDEVARQRSLNAKYLTALWEAFTSDAKQGQSLLMEAIRQRWRLAKVEDAPALAAEITRAQKTLWKFNSIGHIGREGGPVAWMEAVTPITTRQELRLKLPESPPGEDIVIYLAASDLGDSKPQNFVVWEQPRIEFGQGEPIGPILLRDVRALTQKISKSIEMELPRTAQYLEAVWQVSGLMKGEPTALAAGVESDANQSNRPEASAYGSRKRTFSSAHLNPRLLDKWAELTGTRTSREITGLFTDRLTRVQGYEAVNGWGKGITPSLLTNRSQENISFLTLTVPARGVTVHPTPTLESVVAWRSPLDGNVQLAGLVADADDKCGNGAAWRVELLSESGTSRLAGGVLDNGGIERFEKTAIDVRSGDVVLLVVNARDASHVCDTTHIDLKISEIGGKKRVWDLASDIVDDVLRGNPLPDSYGNANTWHFCAGGDQPQTRSPIEPASALALWKAAVLESKPVDEIRRLAIAVQDVLTISKSESLSAADLELRRQLTDWSGPLRWVTSSTETAVEESTGFGLDPSRFGKHPDGSPLDAASLCLQAPQVLQVRLPASLVAGAEFVATGTLHAQTDKDGSAQMQVLTTNPSTLSVSPSLPILANPGSDGWMRIEASMKEFRELFPAALCYSRIVPVDEVVTLTLYHREDDHLKRLMLHDQQIAQLDRLWDELYFVSHEPLKLVDVYEQLTEFATQDRPDLVKAFAPLKKPINERAEKFRQRLVDAQSTHLKAVLEFADRAWRRRLTEAEQESLRDLYQSLREAELVHDRAIRLTIARSLASPAFLYRKEKPAIGKTPAPVTDTELASRLSFFLWSSMPDSELRMAADSGRLSSDELLPQTSRMLRDARTRRLAIEFACQWLHVRDFDKNAEKNEKLYPEFVTLRSDMYEETVRFFEDMFRNDGTILGLLETDHTFLNEALAEHYGIADVNGDEWRRVDDVRSKGRGGVLAMATVLASQSGASRTSPILRGNWVYETLLGERLPRPPPGVPQLPEEPPPGLTTRELIQQHSENPACATCHAKIDPYGFALEQYDAIGRIRPQKVDVHTSLADGTKIEGVSGLRNYLITLRRDDVVRQFCRKLLGYALGRQVQLSDQPLLAQMQRKLAENNYRFSIAVETIVTSRQFLDIRGGD